MFRTQRGISRIGAACAATGLAAVGIIGLSPAAYADTGNLRFRGHAEGTKGSIALDGRLLRVETELMVLGTAGDDSPELLVYCIDLETGLRGDRDYRESTWADSWLKDTAKISKINWVLNNSYPKVLDLQVLAANAGLDSKTVGKGQDKKKVYDLDVKEAVAATQGAIWHYSNGSDVAGWRENDDVRKLYSYLTGAANKGQPNEPTASLALAPTTLSGTDGDTPGVGPVTVKTTSVEPVKVSLADPAQPGVELVGKDGAPINTAADGTELYVKVPKGQKPGEAKIKATTKTGVNIGRVFVGANRKDTQTLIAAGSTPFTTNATAAVKWTHKAVPVPSSAYKEDCVEGGVTVTVANTGDAPADFKVDGTALTVPGDASKTHFVKVAEDAAYSIKVTGPGNYAATYAGTLDCVEEPETPPTSTPPTSTPPTSQPPSSEPPTSEPPTSQPPTSKPPTSEPPTSEPPTSQPPTSQPPTSETPASPADTTPPASSSAPAGSGSPSGSEGPPTPVVVPGTGNDKPITVPWLPVAPAGNQEDLAETGGDDNSTVLIAGAATALLLAGGGAVFLSRRRGQRQA